MSFELTILGSSSALPTSKRYTTAHLLNINERFFLIDCGEGAQIQLRRLHISPVRINHIFITHMHGDHVFGLFGLLSSLGLMGRKEEIHIYGPDRIREMMDSHFQFFTPPPYTINYHVPVPGKIVYSDKHTEVEVISLMHRTTTFGYIFREKEKELNIDKEKIEQYQLGIEEMVKIKRGADHITDDGKVIPNRELTMKPWRKRSYAFISDTGFKPSIVPQLEGVDLLYHEATFLEEDKALARKTMHSTASQAAEIARMAGAGRLLIGHFSTRYKSEDAFLEEAQSIFPDTVAVSDGDVYSIPRKREE